MRYFVTDHVDDVAPSDLHFLESVESLGDSTRSYFSSCVGAGIADLYARQLGYRFNCNSREVQVPSKTQLGDYLYCGGPTHGNEVVMVEAKGSLQRSFYETTFKSIVDDGYTNQVAPHVGQTYSNRVNGRALTIVHGYAVGCGGELSPHTPSAMIGHVVETEPATGRSGGRYAGKAPIGPGDGSGLMPDPAQAPSPATSTVVLGNYRAVAKLLGDAKLVEMVESVRSGQRLREARLPEALTLTEFRGGEFYAVTDDDFPARFPHSGHEEPPGSGTELLRFAIWAPMLHSLLENLGNDREIWEMPAIPARLRRVGHDDGGAVHADGLALLPQRFEDRELPSDILSTPPQDYDQLIYEEVVLFPTPEEEKWMQEEEQRLRQLDLEYRQSLESKPKLTR